MQTPRGNGEQSAGAISSPNLDTLESDTAKSKLLPTMVLDYYRNGSDGQVTVRDNKEAFSRYKFIPRILRDVSKVNPKTCLFGCSMEMPVVVCPMAMHQMAHPHGELAVSRACKAAGCVMILSTMSNYSIEEVAHACGTSHLWFQLYVFKDRTIVRSLVATAQRLGFRALVITVDAPFLGNRESDESNRFHLPPGLSLGNLKHIPETSEDSSTSGSAGASGSSLTARFANQIDASLTWDFLKWLRSITTLPIIVKGVLHPSDALIAVREGAAGVMVSNHGGRQLDHSVAAIDAVAAVRKRLDAEGYGSVPVLIDGGVRRGTDVMKALALGASAVGVGRPMLYALAHEGQAGVERALGMLQRELRLDMALAGCVDVAEVRSSNIVVNARHVPVSKL